MSAATQVSLAEYLSTSYEPDCEYIDGVLEERNVGLRRHGQTVGNLVSRLSQLSEYSTLISVRVQLSASCFRIPDVCLTPADDRDEIVQYPPVLWIEVLAPEDRWSQVQRKLDDVLRFGVPTIWIVDPYDREAWIATSQSLVQAEDGTLLCSNPEIDVELKDILPED